MVIIMVIYLNFFLLSIICAEQGFKRKKKVMCLVFILFIFSSSQDLLHCRLDLLPDQWRPLGIFPPAANSLIYHLLYFIDISPSYSIESLSQQSSHPPLLNSPRVTSLITSISQKLSHPAILLF